MKKYIFKGLLYLCVPVAILGSCKKLDVTAGVEQIVDATFSEASVSFQFMDAKTGMQLDLNGDQDIQISISGKNASDVVNNIGGSNLEAGSGILATALREGVLPTQSNQVEFSIHATATGYLPTDYNVVLRTEGHFHYMVEMVSISDAPAGISINQGTISGVPSTGITASAFSLSPNAVTSSGTTASVTIPAGTKLMDKNNVAVSGTITSTLAYFDPNEFSANQVLDGKMSFAKTSTGADVQFTNYGTISMELTNGNGKEVKNFGSAIQMTMSIPDNATLPDGTALTAGSTLKVFSFTDNLGTWKYESDVVVQMNGSGKLEANFDMTHLSTWSLVMDKYDLLEDIDLRYQNNCNLSNLNNLFPNLGDVVVGYYANGQLYKTKETRAYVGNGEVFNWDLVRNPNFFHASSVIEAKCWKTNNPSEKIDGVFNGSTLNFNWPSNWCPTKSFNILLKTSCPSNPNRMIQPQCFVMAVEEGKWSTGPYIVVGEMKNGLLNTNSDVLTQGKKYSLLTWYQGKPVNLTGSFNNLFGTVEINGNDIDLSRPLTNDECTYLTKIVG